MQDATHTSVSHRSDSDEVGIYASDPIRTDSDDDGLLDGQEESGAGPFEEQPAIPATVDSAFSIFPADLDGDGDEDLVVDCEASNAKYGLFGFEWDEISEERHRTYLNILAELEERERQERHY